MQALPVTPPTLVENEPPPTPPRFRSYHLLYGSPKQKVQYVSPAIAELLGFAASVVRSGGLHFLLSRCEPQLSWADLQNRFYNAARQPGHFLPLLPLCLRHKQGHISWAAWQEMVVEISSSGEPQLVLCRLTPLPAGRSSSLHQGLPGLTTKERLILRYVAQGLTSKDIALKMGISINTVNTHRKNILKRTRCRNSSEVMSFATANGYL